MIHAVSRLEQTFRVPAPGDADDRSEQAQLDHSRGARWIKSSPARCHPAHELPPPPPLSTIPLPGTGPDKGHWRTKANSRGRARGAPPRSRPPRRLPRPRSIRVPTRAESRTYVQDSFAGSVPRPSDVPRQGPFRRTAFRASPSGGWSVGPTNLPSRHVVSEEGIRVRASRRSLPAPAPIRTLHWAMV